MMNEGAGKIKSNIVRVRYEKLQRNPTTIRTMEMTSVAMFFSYFEALVCNLKYYQYKNSIPNQEAMDSVYNIL